MFVFDCILQISIAPFHRKCLMHYVNSDTELVCSRITELHAFHLTGQRLNKLEVSGA